MWERIMTHAIWDYYNRAPLSGLVVGATIGGMWVWADNISLFLESHIF